jgi:prokaryotic membrane lipoprotein lipid attachment site
MILFWRIEKDSLSLLPKNSMKKISLLLFFLFLVGCQNNPQISQELSTSPTSLVEIRNIPYALKNIDYNCI